MKVTWRISLLIIALLLSVLAIRPSFEDGVIVKAVDRDSEVYAQGLRAGEVIKKINNEDISSVEDYAKKINSLFSSGNEARVEIETKETTHVLFLNETPNIAVQNMPKTRLKTGLDIQGGARAVVKPEQNITDQQLDDLIAVSSQRFNVFGISDVQIRGVSDLSGNKFMLVEVAGATPSDLQDLVAKQGKFEAKIGNKTAFIGGNQDITSVCRNDAQCAGISGCYRIQADSYVCNFAFTIYLSAEAAERQAELTRNIPVELSSGGSYLKENLSLIVDDLVVDTLRISKDLQGRAATQISIQGSGTGTTQEEAFKDAKKSMQKLQTILITGSIPFKLEIVKLDTISPTLGNEFVRTILLAGAISILVISLMILARYRKIKLSLALLVTSFSEIVIILGIAALIGWNLDIASIAGILATIGTGVDQQIVIVDEARRDRSASLKERMGRALFIVVAAFATSLASLLPLYWAGAGLFRGFAFTSIIGITAGVLITRPAFADMIKKTEE
jgi:preprotein translocase subunit SecD